MKFAAIFLGTLGAVALSAASTAAAAPEPDRPAVIDQVYKCRDIADAAGRLACYDAAIEQLANAEQRRDILFADREQVQKTKKGLFGLNLGNFNIFGDGRDDDVDEKVNEITAKLVGLRSVDLKMVIILDDGARWQQIDNRILPRTPKPGMEVKIRRAALGSFFANIDGMIGIRVKRIN